MICNFLIKFTASATWQFQWLIQMIADTVVKLIYTVNQDKNIQDTVVNRPLSAALVVKQM